MAFIIQDREAGNFIDRFETLAAAKDALNQYENDDKKDGSYSPDFYEIVEVPTTEMKRIKKINKTGTSLSITITKEATELGLGKDDHIEVILRRC